MNPQKYARLIDSALALEKKEPLEISKKDIPVFSRIKKSLLKTVEPRRDVQRVYAAVVHALGTSPTILRNRVPLDELHKTMSEEVHKIQAAAIMRGAMPFKVFHQSRFFTLFDFGFSRVLVLRVQLQPATERPSTASFIVEEQTYDEIDFDEINFDLVPSINEKKKEPTIQDAVIWPHDEFGK